MDKGEITRGWYGLPERKMDDCVITADLDNDGEEELAIFYSIPTKGDLSTSYLEIHKKIKGKWKLQYRNAYGNVVLDFGVVELFNNKKKQVIVDSGVGASIGYRLFVTQYNGKQYASLLSEKEESLNSGIFVSDIDGNNQKEILASHRFSPLAMVYKRNDKTGFIEVLTDTNSVTLRNYYKLVIAKIKTPFESGGNFNDGYAWALFESYDKLGDSANAITIGKQLMVCKGGDENKYAWYDSVKSRLKVLEKSK